MEFCSICVKVGEHEHAKDYYVQRFEREYKYAVQERSRLQALFREVCWYNFETKCRLWNSPWYETQANTNIEMYGHVFEHIWKRGRLREVGMFPVYYKGKIDEAPMLPPDIILIELVSAQLAMEKAYFQINAAYDWAPGGHLYEKLIRESDGVRAYNILQKTSDLGLHDNELGNNNRKRNRLGGEIQTHQKARKDILG